MLSLPYPYVAPIGAPPGLANSRRSRSDDDFGVGTSFIKSSNPLSKSVAGGGDERELLPSPLLRDDDADDDEPPARDDERVSSRSRSDVDRPDVERDDEFDADLAGALAANALANDDAEPLKPIFGISGASLPSANNLIRSRYAAIAAHEYR